MKSTVSTKPQSLNRIVLKEEKNWVFLGRKEVVCDQFVLDLPINSLFALSTRSAEVFLRGICLRLYKDSSNGHMINYQICQVYHQN